MNVKPQTHDRPKHALAVVVTYRPYLPGASIKPIQVRDFYPPRIK